MIRLNMAEEKKLVEGIGCLITFREVLLEGLMTSDFREAEGLHTLVFNRKCISLSPKKKIIKKLIQNRMKKTTRKKIMIKIKVKNIILKIMKT